MRRYAEGVALSQDGATLYVADGDNHCVRAVSTADGTTHTVAGTGNIGKDDGETAAQA